MDGPIPALKARAAFASALSRDLVTQPISLTCPHCGEAVLSSMEWTCGYCRFDNKRTALYSFLYKCQKCDREAKSFLCPHCSKVCFLDGDNDRANPARRCARTKPKKATPVPEVAPAPLPNLPVPIPPEPKMEHYFEPKEDPRVERKRAHEDRKERLFQEIEIAELTARLEAIRSPRAEKEEDAMKSRLEKELNEYVGRLIGGYVTAREFKNKIAERYKDDPEILHKANDVVAKWLEERML